MNTTNGLVVSYLFKDGGGETANWEQIKQWNPEQGLLWMHLDYADERARKWLFGDSGVDALTCGALVAEETRPRIVTSPDSMLLILRGVNCNPGADPEDMVSLRVLLEERRIISMRHRRVMAVDDIRKSIEEGKGPRSTQEFLTMLLTGLTDRMGDVLADIDDRADELEDLVLTAQSYELRPKLAHVRRQVIGLRRYIAPQRDVLARVQGETISWLTAPGRNCIRELAERTARFVDDLDAARDRAAVTREELSSRLTEQMNTTMYRLSVIAAIFLPLGFATGLLGINVGGIPGTESRYAFALVSVVLVAIAVVEYAFFKRKKWL